MELRRANKNDYRSIKKLYISAFPRDERAPFFMLKKRAFQGKAEMLAAEENGEFIGFAYAITYRDMVYVFYLAVAKGKRGQGYGGKILGLLKKHFEGKALFLAREQLDDKAENIRERINRRNFYLANGFKDLPYRIREATVIYDLMSTDEEINIKDYNILIKDWAGPVLSRLVKLEVLEG